MHVRIASLLDRSAPERELADVMVHVESCRECGAEYESLGALRATLRAMDRAPLPAGLPSRLRVLASHERLRQMTRASLGARARHIASHVRLVFDNLMRPVALPFAGGLFSALFLFSLLVPSISFSHNFADDPPLSLLTFPDGKVVGAVGEVPRIQPVEVIIAPEEKETIVELTVDPRGNVREYSVTYGKLTPDMVSVILFSHFTPATFFGRPTWGKVQVALRPVHSIQG